MPIKPDDIAKMITKQGWRFLRQGKGSHRVYEKDGKITIIAFHKGKDVPLPTIRKIEKQTGVKLLKK
jgi:mRNA interferase HicA